MNGNLGCKRARLVGTVGALCRSARCLVPRWHRFEDAVTSPRSIKPRLSVRQLSVTAASGRDASVKMVSERARYGVVFLVLRP